MLTGFLGFRMDPILWAETLLRRADQSRSLGGDVVEVSPPYDEAAKTAIVGAIVTMDILHILGEARNADR